MFIDIYIHNECTLYSSHSFTLSYRCTIIWIDLLYTQSLAMLEIRPIVLVDANIAIYVDITSYHCLLYICLMIH